MNEKLKSLLIKIQNSDETTKRRWLVVSSAAAMVVVFGLWLLYMNMTIGQIGASVETQDIAIGPWQIFKAGLKAVGQSIKNNISGLIGKLTNERTVIIER